MERDGRLAFYRYNLSEGKLRTARSILESALKDASWELFSRKIIRWFASKGNVVEGEIVSCDESGLCELALLRDDGSFYSYPNVKGLLYSGYDGTPSDRNSGMYVVGKRLTMAFKDDSYKAYQLKRGRRLFVMTRNRKQWLWGVLRRAEERVWQESKRLATYILGEVDFVEGTAVIDCYEKPLAKAENAQKVVEEFKREGIRALVRLSTGDSPLMQERRENNKFRWGIIKADVLRERLLLIEKARNVRDSKL
jgi:hypothetical protein